MTVRAWNRGDSLLFGDRFDNTKTPSSIVKFQNRQNLFDSSKQFSIVDELNAIEAMQIYQNHHVDTLAIKCQQKASKQEMHRPVMTEAITKIFIEKSLPDPST